MITVTWHTKFVHGMRHRNDGGLFVSHQGGTLELNFQLQKNNSLLFERQGALKTVNAGYISEGKLHTQDESFSKSICSLL